MNREKMSRNKKMGESEQSGSSSCNSAHKHNTPPGPIPKIWDSAAYHDWQHVNGDASSNDSDEDEDEGAYTPTSGSSESGDTPSLTTSGAESSVSSEPASPSWTKKFSTGDPNGARYAAFKARLRAGREGQVGASLLSTSAASASSDSPSIAAETSKSNEGGEIKEKVPEEALTKAKLSLEDQDECEEFYRSIFECCGIAPPEGFFGESETRASEIPNEETEIEKSCPTLGCLFDSIRDAEGRGNSDIEENEKKKGEKIEEKKKKVNQEFKRVIDETGKPNCETLEATSELKSPPPQPRGSTKRQTNKTDNFAVINYYQLASLAVLLISLLYPWHTLLLHSGSTLNNASPPSPTVTSITTIVTTTITTTVTSLPSKVQEPSSERTPQAVELPVPEGLVDRSDETTRFRMECISESASGCGDYKTPKMEELKAMLENSQEAIRLVLASGNQDETGPNMEEKAQAPVPEPDIINEEYEKGSAVLFLQPLFLQPAQINWPIRPAEHPIGHQSAKESDPKSEGSIFPPGVGTALYWFKDRDNTLTPVVTEPQQPTTSFPTSMPTKEPQEETPTPAEEPEQDQTPIPSHHPCLIGLIHPPTPDRFYFHWQPCCGHAQPKSASSTSDEPTQRNHDTPHQEPRYRTWKETVTKLPQWQRLKEDLEIGQRNAKRIACVSSRALGESLRMLMLKQNLKQAEEALAKFKLPKT